MAKRRKQHQGPLTDDWINHIWCICTMEYHSDTCYHMDDPEDIVLSEHASLKRTSTV